MKRISKLNLILTSVGCSIAIAAPAVIIPVLNNLQQTVNASTGDYYYLFNNKFYDSIEAATKDTVIKNKPISSELYVGDINDSIFDQQSRRLDISRLRLYDRERMLPAFKNAIGQYEHSYKTAKDSFVNQGLIDYLYDDFKGNLYYDEKEAIKSIMESTTRTPITYHELSLSNDGNKPDKFTINPFNAEDINAFKEKVLRNLQSDRLDVKVYDVIDDPTDPNKIAYSSAPAAYLNKEDDYLRDFANKIAFEYAKAKDELIWGEINYIDNIETRTNPLKWDVTVTAVRENVDVDYNFVIHGISSGVNDPVVSYDSKNLIFNGVSSTNLQEFDRFIYRNEFVNKHLVQDWTPEWGKPVVCEIADAYENFLGLGYGLRYNGENWGLNWGPDIKILESGSYKGYGLKFDVKIKLSNPKTAKQRFEEKLVSTFSDEFIKKELDKNPTLINNSTDKSYSFNLYKKIKNKLVNNVFDQEANTFFNPNKSITKHKEKDSNFKMVNNVWNDTMWNLKGESPIWQFDDKKIFTQGAVSGKDSPYSNNIKFSENILSTYYKDLGLLHNDLSTWSKHLKYIIEYNGYPLFEIPSKIFEEKISKPGLFDSSSGLSGLNISKTLNKKDLYTYLSVRENVDELKKTLVNVSSKFNTTSDKLNYLPYDYSSKKYTYSKYKQNDNGLFEYDLQSSLPNIENKDLDYKVDVAMAMYNKALDNIVKNSSGGISENTKSLKIAPNEVLSLYRNDGHQSNETFYYSEYLTNKSSFNGSLFAKNNTALYNKEVDIIAAIERSKILKPSKIVILYDILGNILNAGIRLSENERLLTTSSAIYDSRNSVIDNVLRTKVIRNDVSKAFYSNPNGTYTLLTNQTDLVFQLSWEKKNYYFPTWDDAWNYLYEFIKLQAVKYAR